MQCEVENLQSELVGQADLVDRGSARRAEFDRALGRLDRTRRYPAPRHAVIAGKNRNQRPVDRGWRASGPFCQPRRDVFHAAERAGRLFGFGKQRPHPVCSRLIPSRKIFEQGSEIVEGKRARHVNTCGTKMRAA